jgi:hypothetical protein
MFNYQFLLGILLMQSLYYNLEKLKNIGWNIAIYTISKKALIH